MKRLMLLAAALAISFVAAAGDPGAGKAKTRMCAGCHGIPDYRIAYPEVYSVPKIGGQDADYIAKSLEAYRSGARKHVAMQAMAAQLTDQDIADIAAFYAEGAAKLLAHGEATEAEGKKAEGACAACHGPAGAKPTMPGAPKLAGQQYEYLVRTLEDLRSGKRESPIMGAMAKPLTDADIRAMARYYSELPGLQTKY